MANSTEGSGYSPSGTQRQEYFSHLHQQHLAQSQPAGHREQLNPSGGGNGFHPNAWGWTRSHHGYHMDHQGEETSTMSREERFHPNYYYEQTARSFSAAAAVAAVAAAAYISSSSAAVSSSYFGDGRRGGNETSLGDKTTNSSTEDSIACKSESYSSSRGARITDYAATSSQPTPSTSTANVPLIAEAHSNPASYSPGAQTAPQPKYQPAFMNGAENDGYGYPSQNLPPSTALITSHPPTNSTARRRAEKAPAHVKKPLNAFMLFMKEMRAKVVAECTMKESAAINQILGRKWHALPHEEQAKFYEMAKKEKELHQRKYPGWSARDNYAYHAKRRKNRCRYRVFNSNQSYGEQPSQQQAQHGGQMLESSSPSSGQESLPRDKSKVNSETPFEFSGALKNSSFYGSPFGLTGMPYENRGSGDSSYNIVGELLPGFGFMDRNVPPNYSDGFPNHGLQQHPHPSSSQSLSHNDSNCNSKDDSVPRLMAGISEYGDAISSGQHFSPNLPPGTQNQANYTAPANWLLNSTHYPHLAYDVLSSASTSPWSQSQQKFEDRFQRQLTQSSSSTFSNPYSTPPYNPNGSFDYRYTDLNPSTYTTIPQSSPLPLDNESSLRSAYEGVIAKPSTFQADCVNSSCGDESSSTAPLYGFSTI